MWSSSLRGRLREVLRGSSAEDLTEPLAKLVEELVAELRPVKVVLAGSLARGEFVRGLSDVDLLVVVDYEVPRDRRFVYTHVGDVDVEVTVVSRRELEEAVRGGREFYVEAAKRGTVIYEAETATEPHAEAKGSS